VDELEADPQVRHLGTFYEVAHPKRGKVKAQHRPLRIDGSREIDFRAPPMLGEHTEEVLAEAGFSSQEIQVLRGKGIL
jgi:crotonobetainyl-CoA:carnitine CoA-transferase CaiB-like acyl-CoA transferase